MFTSKSDMFVYCVLLRPKVVVALGVIYLIRKIVTALCQLLGNIHLSFSKTTTRMHSGVNVKTC